VTLFVAASVLAGCGGSKAKAPATTPISVAKAPATTPGSAATTTPTSAAPTPASGAAPGNQHVATGKLAALYDALVTACNADPTDCDNAELPVGADQQVNNDAIAFCNRAMPDAAPMLQAIGDGAAAAAYTTSSIQVITNVPGQSTIASSGIQAGSGAIVVCLSYEGKSTGPYFELALSPSPPGELGFVTGSNSGTSDLPVGKDCQIQSNHDDLAMACVTNGGWAFGLLFETLTGPGTSTSASPAMVRGAAQQQYQVLNADL
jgi:hypothetical protein